MVELSFEESRQFFLEDIGNREHFDDTFKNYTSCQKTPGF